MIHSIYSSVFLKLTQLSMFGLVYPAYCGLLLHIIQIAFLRLNLSCWFSTLKVFCQGQTTGDAELARGRISEIKLQKYFRAEVRTDFKLNRLLYSLVSTWSKRILSVSEYSKDLGYFKFFHQKYLSEKNDFQAQNGLNQNTVLIKEIILIIYRTKQTYCAQASQNVFLSVTQVIISIIHYECT